MNKITENFFSKSKIEQSKTNIAIMEFLADDRQVNKMIVASDMGIPAITPVVAELEKKFDDVLNHTGKNQQATNRQNVGRMIKYVMSQFGYVPIDGGLSEKARVPKFANSKYFATSAIYRKLQKGKYEFTHTRIDVI